MVASAIESSRIQEQRDTSWKNSAVASTSSYLLDILYFPEFAELRLVLLCRAITLDFLVWSKIKQNSQSLTATEQTLFVLVFRCDLD